MSVPLFLANSFNPFCLSGCHYAIPKAFPLSPTALVFSLLSYNKFPTIPAAACALNPLDWKNSIAFFLFS
jgi:hypothetical protein